MTGSADFTPEEWDTIQEGPTSAGMIVSSAQRGGTFREAFAMAKSFTDARQEQGDSALLDELVATKPEMDRTKARSPEELREKGLRRIRDAVSLLQQKATPDEVEDYRGFVITLAQRVAAAMGVGGDDKTSDAERAAIEEIEGALRG
jgi:hypothetical protein